TSSFAGRKLRSSCVQIDSTKAVTVRAHVRTPQPVANTRFALGLEFFSDAACDDGALLAQREQSAQMLSEQNAWESVAFTVEPSELGPQSEATHVRITLRARYQAQVGSGTDAMYFDALTLDP